MTFQAILTEALALPAEQRAELAKRLAETLGSPEATEQDRVWAAEIHRRLDDLTSGRVETVSVETVMARVRQKLNADAR